MIIRDETARDVDAIRCVVERAFGRPDEAEIVSQLRRDGSAVASLVAEDERGLIVGHVMLSTMAAPFPALGLAPLAVRPSHQRRGIGSRLVRSAIARAADGSGSRAVALFVLGNPAYYGRFGFDAARAAGFQSRYAGPHFMVLALGGPLPATTGVVACAAALEP